MGYSIRPANAVDAASLPAIEQSAGALFRSTGDAQLALLAEDIPMTTGEHQVLMEEWQSHGLTSTGTWVAVEIDQDTEKLVGFIVASLVSSKVATTPQEGDGVGAKGQSFIYINELSVHADHQRKGLARNLVSAVKDCATQATLSQSVGVGLVTMRDVSFNKQFYEKLGFREMKDEQEIVESFGIGALDILEKDKNAFRQKGDGSMASRRCWMGWSSS